MRYFLAFILFWVVVNTTAQTIFENDIRFYDKPRVTLTHYSEYAITERFGIADYVFVTNDWGELTVGPYYKPTENSLITVLPGIETDNQFRIGFYGYVVSGFYTVSAFYEHGNIDYWDFQLRRDWSHYTVMLRARQGYGLGIPIGYRFSNFQVMYTHYFDIEGQDHKFLPTISFNLLL